MVEFLKRYTGNKKVSGGTISFNVFFTEGAVCKNHCPCSIKSGPPSASATQFDTPVTGMSRMSGGSSESSVEHCKDCFKQCRHFNIVSSRLFQIKLNFGNSCWTELILGPGANRN